MYLGLAEAFGTFVKVDDKIFRTEVRLQWGDSDKLLCLLIMLNPGSCNGLFYTRI
jgi:hypothetical protein